MIEFKHSKQKALFVQYIAGSKSKYVVCDGENNYLTVPADEHSRESAVLALCTVLGITDGTLISGGGDSRYSAVYVWEPTTGGLD
jgi:hypothetical protein